ncbi:MAG: phytanoyl-CoA dioxygenase family protein [SAR86 cluster bacterium]|tara:strand:- start:659 stop:1540 length:882 start_codon:yes stop_codon:yes gene_type:complete
MAKEEQGNSSKEEFTNRINKQKGRISSKLIEETKYLSQTQKQSWNEKGFILIPNFFPEDKCIEINQTVIDIVRSMVGNSEEFNHAYIDQGHIGIREMKPSHKIENIEDEMSKVFRLHQTGIFNEFIKRDDLLNIVEDILGENIDCFLSQFIFKNPGAWGQPWHQDSSYFPFDRAPQVGAWLATSAATKENGCLVILPGSHKEVIHEHLPDDRPGSNYGYTEIKDHDFKKEMPLFLNTGDLLLFHSFLMHKSYDNKSNNRRTAMVYHFAETGTDFGELDSPTNEWISVRGKGLP